MSRTLAPDDPEAQGAVDAPHGCKWYVACFAHKFLNFRCAEVEALAGMAGCPSERITWQRPHSLVPPENDVPEMNPFWRVALPGDDVCKFVASRTILCKVSTRWGMRRERCALLPSSVCVGGTKSPSTRTGPAGVPGAVGRGQHVGRDAGGGADLPRAPQGALARRRQDLQGTTPCNGGGWDAW